MDVFNNLGKDPGDPAVGVTRTVSKENVSTNIVDYWNYEDQQKVRVIHDRVASMRIGRRSSCYWDSNTIVRSSDSRFGSGSDWVETWNKAYKLWSMWRRDIPGKSNMKSPISFAPVEAFMAEFQENNTGCRITAQSFKDQGKAKLFEQAIEYLEEHNNFAAAKAESFHECMITGTAITYTGFVRRERKVKMIMTPSDTEKKMDELLKKNDKSSKDELIKMRKTLDEDKKPLLKETTIIDYNNIASIPVSVYEFYKDPAARCLRGNDQEAMDCAWITYPTVEQARNELRNSSDPFINKDAINGIISWSEYEMGDSFDSKSFFDIPGELKGVSGSKVWMVKYYNKITDTYAIVVNNILIRDGPLPYNHKQLPFSLHRFIKFPHQFYGIGLPTLLEPFQTGDEQMRNMSLQLMKKILRPPLFLDKQKFKTVDKNWDFMDDNLKIEVDGDPNEGIMWAQMPPSNLNDVMAVRKDIQNDVLLTAGVNPAALALPNPGEAVRNNMMGQESTLKILQKNMKNWGEGYIEDCKQRVSIMQQMYTADDLDEMDSNNNPKKKYREILLKNMKAVPDKEQGIKFEPDKSDNNLELKPEYMSLDVNNCTFKFDMDSFLPATHAVQQQAVQQALQILPNIIVNPQLMESPIIQELLRVFQETSGLPAKVMDSLNDDDEEEDVTTAMAQNEVMVGGQSVPGEPGRSWIHQWVHGQKIIELQTILNNPNRMHSPEDMNNLSSTIQKLITHLAQDSVPAQQISQAAQQPSPAQQLPQMQPGEMQGQPPMGGPLAQPQNPMMQGGMSGGPMPMDPGVPVGGQQMIGAPQDGVMQPM